MEMMTFWLTLKGPVCDFEFCDSIMIYFAVTNFMSIKTSVPSPVARSYIKHESTWWTIRSAMLWWKKIDDSWFIEGLHFRRSHGSCLLLNVRWPNMINDRGELFYWFWYFLRVSKIKKENLWAISINRWNAKQLFYNHNFIAIKIPCQSHYWF